MLILDSASDILRVVTSAAGSIRAHASWVDNTTGYPAASDNLPTIGSATTTTLVSGPSSGQRNVTHVALFNDSGSVANTLTLEHTDGTDVSKVWSGTLQIGEFVIFTENGEWNLYTSAGVIKAFGSAILFSNSTAGQGPGFASDTYLTGSYVKFPAGGPRAGAKYTCRFDVSKTGAGTGAPTITVRVGTAGTTGDTGRHTLTHLVGTGVIDTGTFTVDILWRSVGGSGVSQARSTATHSLSTTGLINQPAQTLVNTSAAYDTTTAGLGIGMSLNGGASAAWTVQMVDAELKNF